MGPYMVERSRVSIITLYTITKAGNWLIPDVGGCGQTVSKTIPITALLNIFCICLHCVYIVMEIGNAFYANCMPIKGSILIAYRNTMTVIDFCQRLLIVVHSSSAFEFSLTQKKAQDKPGTHIQPGPRIESFR